MGAHGKMKGSRKLSMYVAYSMETPFSSVGGVVGQDWMSATEGRSIVSCGDDDAVCGASQANKRCEAAHHIPLKSQDVSLVLSLDERKAGVHCRHQGRGDGFIRQRLTD
jgi:hypothetical protein